MFKSEAFQPTRAATSEINQITLFKDELETLKLCDLDGLTQERAGRKMGISRGTVQRILTSARRKTALALSECRIIIFEDLPCDSKKY